MKKIRFVSALLLAAVLLRAPIPAFAAEPSAETTQETTAPTVASQLPIPSLDTDASAANGSRGKDAQIPLRTDAVMKSGDAALLYEMDSDTMLYGVNPDRAVDPAGLVKLMTALVAVEHANRSEQITVTQQNIDGVPQDSTRFGLKAGETLTLEQLLYCLLLESANDAAVVLAEHTLGSQSAFVDEMNARAKQLGCTGTNFTNVHGIHDDLQYTTARDLLKIVSCALEYDLFREVFSAQYYLLPATNLCSEERELYSRNYMGGTIITQAYYDARCTGGKTAFNRDGKRSIVITAEMDGLHFIGIVLDTVPDTAEDDISYILEFNEFWEMRRILNLVEGQYAIKRVLYEGEFLRQFPVTGGTESVTAVAARNVDTLLPTDTTQENLTYRLVRGGETLTAPVAAGDTVDLVQVWYGSVCVAQSELIAVNSSRAAPVQTAPSGGTTEQRGSGTGLKVLAVIGGIVLVIALLFAALYAVRMFRLSKLRAKRRRRRSERRRSR